MANGEENPLFKKVLNAASNAFKHLHKMGGYKPENIKEKPYQKLIDETVKVFESAIQDNDIPVEMLNALKSDAFLFGSLKTHAQLMEASTMLLEDGKVKSFQAFERDFQKLNVVYNQNYLEAEYQFAVNSSQMADNWAQLNEDGRYYLQYRTANDSRVRDEHAALQDITLPKEDDFWLSYYPPNGWRCRCQVVEVRKSKYEASDSSKVMELGEKATTQIGKDGKNRLEIFRFNPGIEQKLFPPKHPYKKVKGSKEVIETISPKYVPENLNTYEKKLKVSINKEFFNHLGKETPLLLKNPSKGLPKGAFYSPTGNYVKIPIDERRKNSKWFARAVIYHEFGHAADHHHGLRSSKGLKDLMNKYREEFAKEDDKLYKELDQRLDKLIRFALERNHHDLAEKTGAAMDTLMSLNFIYGFGHTVSYFSRQGMSEAEFIAHCFENAYSGNEVMKKYMPKLYDDMIKWVEEIKKDL